VPLTDDKKSEMTARDRRSVQIYYILFYVVCLVVFTSRWKKYLEKKCLITLLLAILPRYLFRFVVLSADYDLRSLLFGI